MFVLPLAGTDLFYPSLGRWLAQSVAAPYVDPAMLVPFAPDLYDSSAYAQMRAMRKPYALVHLYGFSVLGGTALLHIAAAVLTELREGGTLIPAMFTGRKILHGQPVDPPVDCSAS